MTSLPVPARLPDPALAAPERPGGDPSGVLIRYWAGARAASGVEQEVVPAGPIGALLNDLVQARPNLAGVLPLCVLLLDGRSVDPGDEVGIPAGAVLEVLPPFAGG